MVCIAESELAMQEEAEAMQDFTTRLRKAYKKYPNDVFVPITFENIDRARRVLKTTLDDIQLHVNLAKELEAKIKAYEEYVERDTEQAVEGGR